MPPQYEEVIQTESTNERQLLQCHLGFLSSLNDNIVSEHRDFTLPPQLTDAVLRNSDSILQSSLLTQLDNTERPRPCVVIQKKIRLARPHDDAQSFTTANTIQLIGISRPSDVTVESSRESTYQPSLSSETSCSSVEEASPQTRPSTTKATKTRTRPLPRQKGERQSKPSTIQRISDDEDDIHELVVRRLMENTRHLKPAKSKSVSSPKNNPPKRQRPPTLPMSPLQPEKRQRLAAPDKKLLDSSEGSMSSPAKLSSIPCQLAANKGKTICTPETGNRRTPAESQAKTKPPSKGKEKEDAPQQCDTTDPTHKSSSKPRAIPDSNSMPKPKDLGNQNHAQQSVTIDLTGDSDDDVKISGEVGGFQNMIRAEFMQFRQELLGMHQRSMQSIALARGLGMRNGNLWERERRPMERYAPVDNRDFNPYAQTYRAMGERRRL